MYDRQVFLNVPFDHRYQPLLRALVFSVHECGLLARCALERDDGGEVRLEKIFAIIERCRYGIHDLSRTTLDRANRLPRFNMPLELGIFLGARRFGGAAQRRKTCLILDAERYRYQKFCSDIAGQDIRAHHNEIDSALSAVRNWLQASLPASARLPHTAVIERRYLQFRRQLRGICRREGLRTAELTFLDYRNLVTAWLEETPRAAAR